MEFHAPGLFPILWTLFSLAALTLTIIALYFLLTSKTKNYKHDFLWFVAILFLPFLGSINYLANRKKR